jgi:hypothetical protein
MYRIVVTCHYPDWPAGVKTWCESLSCVVGPIKKLSAVKKLLRRRGFEHGQHYPFTWTVHPGGDEPYYEAKIVQSYAEDSVLMAQLPEHICRGDDDIF